MFDNVTCNLNRNLMVVSKQLNNVELMNIRLMIGPC